MGSAQEEFYGETTLVADRADDVLSGFHRVLVHTENAGVFLSIEEGGFQPADIERDAFFQERLFDQPLAVRICYLAEFDFVVYFHSSVQWLIHFVFTSN